MTSFLVDFLNKGITNCMVIYIRFVVFNLVSRGVATFDKQLADTRSFRKQDTNTPVHDRQL